MAWQKRVLATQSSIRPFTRSQLLHIQLITSGDTKCWLSAFINLDHGFLLCLHNMIYLLSKDNYISPLRISFSDDPNACNIFPFSTKLQSKITSSHIGNHTNVNIIDFVSSKVIAKHFFRGGIRYQLQTGIIQFISFDHNPYEYKLYLPTRASSWGSSSSWYLFRYAFNSSVPSTCSHSFR